LFLQEQVHDFRDHASASHGHTEEQRVLLPILQRNPKAN
jgi:hypothetical protein